MFCSLSVLSHMSSEIREFNKDHGCMSSTLVVLPYHPVSFSAITASGTTFLPKSLYITFYGSRLPSRVTNLASSLTWLFQSQSYTLVFQVYIPFPFFQFRDLFRLECLSRGAHSPFGQSQRFYLPCHRFYIHYPLRLEA